MKAKQKLFVLNQLLEKGQVSRNTCLSKFITRLGAIMCLFQKQGLRYIGVYRKDKNTNDYVYILGKGQKRLLNNLMNTYN